MLPVIIAALVVGILIDVGVSKVTKSNALGTVLGIGVCLVIVIMLWH
jgi:amino acid transporter